MRRLARSRHETILLAILLVALVGLGFANDRFLTRRQPAQPGPADDRDRPDRAADDLRHHHRRHRSLGRLDRRPVRDPARLFLEELSAFRCRWRSCSRSASARWPGSSTGCHHPAEGAAADHDASPRWRSIAASPRAISQAHSVRGYPEWFYLLGQGELLRRADAALAARRGDRRFRRRARPHHVRPHALRDRLQRDGGAVLRRLPVDRVKLIVYTLSGLMAGAVRVRARLARDDDALGHGHRLRARRRSRPWCSAAPASSAARARSGAR